MKKRRKVEDIIKIAFYCKKFIKNRCFQNLLIFIYTVKITNIIAIKVAKLLEVKNFK